MFVLLAKRDTTLIAVLRQPVLNASRALTPVPAVFQMDHAKRAKLLTAKWF